MHIPFLTLLAFVVRILEVCLFKSEGVTLFYKVLLWNTVRPHLNIEFANCFIIILIIELSISVLDILIPLTTKFSTLLLKYCSDHFCQKNDQDCTSTYAYYQLSQHMHNSAH